MEKARKAIDVHAGLRGTSFEDIFKKFLREYLPPSLDIFSGIIVDSTGNQSKQLDVIIADAAKTPIFYKSENVRVVPVECVYAVIEVKATLDAEELKKVYANMTSVKCLQKTSFIPTENIVLLYGTKYDIWPITYYVFAFDSIKLETISEYMKATNKEQKLAIDKRIDSVAVLNKGVICYILDNGTIDTCPHPNSRTAVVTSAKSLLLFYGLLTRILLQAWLPPFQLNRYLKDFVT